MEYNGESSKRNKPCPVFFIKLAFVVSLLFYLVLSSVKLGFERQPVVKDPSFRVNRYLLTIEYSAHNSIGDLMFNYASLVGIGAMNKLDAILPTTFPLFVSFTNLSIKAMSESELDMHSWLKHSEYGGKSSSYDLSTEYLPSKQNIKLNGYYQSWEYFHYIEDKVRKDFQFKPEISAVAQEFHNIIFQKYTRLVIRVGIQIRRAALGQAQYDFGETTPDKDYYIEAMHYFSTRYPKIVFIVSGDSILWWKENVLASSYHFEYLTGHNQIQELAILSMCDHSIISSGTLGWWAAWLANGTTVYYSNWPKPFSSLDEKVTKKDYFCKNWIPLPAINKSEDEHLNVINTCSVNNDVKEQTLQNTSEKSTRSSTSKHNDTQEFYISTSAYDGRRLGNLMFNYAALLGVAKTNNKTAIMACEFPQIYSFFKLKLPQYGDFKDKMGKYEDFGERNSASNTYDNRTEKLKPDQNIMLNGFYQSWKYFDHMHATVREHFQFKHKILSPAQQYINSLKKKFGSNYVFVGVHVRRGDKANDLSKRLFGDITPDFQFYNTAMSYFTFRFPQVVFIICSDDIKWSKLEITFATHIEFSTNRSPPEDLAILSLCDHTIMSVGTFGWWAAWFVNGTAVYYDGWPGRGSPLEKKVTKEDFFYKSWIPIKDGETLKEIIHKGEKLKKEN